MGFLVGLASNWRWIAAAVLALGLAWAGFWLKGKIDRAAEADRLESVLDETTSAFKAQIKATFDADQRRLKVSQELAEAREKREVVVKEVIRVIRQSPSDPRCSIPVDVVRQLNAARGHVPEPSE